jgi:hypothetical protein
MGLRAKKWLFVISGDPSLLLHYAYASVPDPNPNPDPDPNQSSKNSKKNLDFYSFVTLFYFLSLKNDVKVPSKSTMQKNLFLIRFLLAS